MLRLAHRIAAQKLFVKCPQSIPSQAVVSAARAFQVALSMAEVVIADNVAHYVQSIGRDATGVIDGVTRGCLMLCPEDIPNCTPPFKNLFVEWVPVGEHDSCGVLEAGVLFQSCSVEECKRDMPSADVPSDAQTCVVAMHAYCDKSGAAIYDGNYLLFFCDHSGRLIDDFGRRIEGSDFYLAPLGTPLMAISFMHCKNVTRRDVTDTEGPSAKWLRRTKAPEIRYHVLDINPMKEVLRKEGDIEHNGLKKALHICRGHFATYTDERPLFGKVSGTFWVPSHVRGSVEHGIVDKDYRVKAPAKDLNPPPPAD